MEKSRKKSAREDFAARTPFDSDALDSAALADGGTAKPKKSEKFKRIFFSEFILGQSSEGRKIAIVAVLTALCVIVNALLTFPVPTLVPTASPNTISLNMCLCFLSGSVLGAFYGFSVGLVSDLLCFLLFNSRGYMFFPWVSLSKAFSGFIAGIVMCNFKTKRKGGVYVKAVIVALFTLLICTAGIESGGYYLYYKYVRHWTFNSIVSKLLEVFGAGEITINYFWYIAYRLIVLLRIAENGANLLAFLLLIPVVNSSKAIGAKIR